MLSRRQLIQQIKLKKSFLCVGLDTDIEKIPSFLKAYPDPIFEFNKRIIDACIAGGLLTDWFLFAPQCMRIAPPLTISKEEIEKACTIILSAI